MTDAFRFDEKYLSQIPALQVLVNLGYQYLTPAEALAARGGKAGSVLLEEILRDRLKTLNRIQHKGGSYLFSEENVQSAIQRLKNVKYDGLLKTNEAVYDLLTLGVALEQSIEGDLKSFTLNYVDWRNPANNVYHVAAEFTVERTRSAETCRPDVVLFVNGIPFAVIECKSPKVEVAQAISQTIKPTSSKSLLCSPSTRGWSSPTASMRASAPSPRTASGSCRGGPSTARGWPTSI